MKGALVAFLVATFSFAASAQMAPPEEQLQAGLDSPFIQRLLAGPFTADHQSNLAGVQTLRYGGHEKEARLLERAEQRRLLALVVGEPSAPPATFKDAIALEAEGALPLEDRLRAALARVSLAYASERDPGAPTVGPDETRVADGMWTKPSMQLTQVHALFRIRNDLPVPLRAVGMKYLNVSCEAENPRDIAPGSTRVVLCRGDDRTERIGDLLDPLVQRKARNPFAPDWVRIGNLGGAGEVLVTAFDDRASLSFEDGGKDGARQAFAALAGAACEDKGTCQVIVKVEQQRVEAERKQAAPSRNFGIGALIAFVLAALAAAAVKPRPSPGFVMPAVALLALAFSAFTIATGYYSLQPGASAAWLLALFGVYYGALPFVLAIAALGGSLASGHVTRLRAFALAFGVGVSILAVVTMAQKG